MDKPFEVGPFQTLMESLNVPAMIIGQDRRVLAINQAAHDFGVSIGSFCWDTFGKKQSISDQQKTHFETTGIPLDRTHCQFCHANKALAEKQAVVVNIELGESLWQTHWIPVSAEAYLHYALDVTGEKKSENKFEPWFEHAQKMAGIGLWEQDYPSGHLWWSDQVYRIVGLPRCEEMTMDQFLSMVDPQDRGKIKGETEKLHTISGYQYQVEYTLIQPNGSKRRVHEEATVFQDCQEKPLRIVGIIQDITDLTVAKETIRDQTDRLNLSLQVARGGSWDRDLKTGKISWDQGMERLFGISPGTFSGTSAEWENKVHPEDLRRVTESVLHAVKKRLELRVEYRIKNSHGHGWLFVETFGQVITNNLGVPIRMVGICLDVTERVEATARFRTIFENASDGIVVMNLTTRRLIMANSTFCKQLGYTSEELISLSVDNIHPAEALPMVNQRLEQTAQRGTSLHQNIPMLRKDGQTFPVDIAVATIVMNGEKCLLGLCRDITQRILRENHEKLRADRYQALLELSQFDTEDIDYLANFTMEKFVHLSRSAYGFLGFVSHDESEIIIHSWSSKAMEQCTVLDPTVTFSVSDVGIWGEAVRQRQTLLLNNYKDFTGKKSLPAGHPPITRLISHPVFDGKKIIAVAAVANKETDYTEEDVQQISLMCLTMNQNIKERQLDKARLETEEKFRSLAESATDAIVSVNEYGKIVFWNNWAQRIFQYTREEALAESITLIVPARYEDKHLKGLNDALKNGHLKSKPGDIFSVFGKRKDGTETPLEMTLSSWAVKNNTYFTAILRDVSDKKQMENHLRQAQKMEAIGTLAGGIAHDFNNILAIILGNVELAAMNTHESEMSYAEIRTAAMRGRELVRQLMAFGRHNQPQKVMLNPANTIKDVLKFMRSTLPTSVELIGKIEDDGVQIFVDPTQLYQILVNLCTNAGQAIGERSGILELAQEKINLVGNEAFKLGVQPGDFLRISVRDTGSGISDEVLDRIFDPFFTTKEEGKGSGMGLAVVHGAIKDCGGAIKVESEFGKGSIFQVYIPTVLVASTKNQSDASEATAEVTIGAGKILFVDDEPGLVRVGVRALERMGYTVVGTADPVNALAIFMESPDSFDVVITDQSMPVLNGDVLSARILALRPNQPIFLCTGFSENMTAERAAEIGLHGFFQKPVSMDAISNTIKRIIKKA